MLLRRTTRNAFIMRMATGRLGRSMKSNAHGHGDDRLCRRRPLPFTPMPTRINNKDLETKYIAVTLRLATKPMTGINTAQ